MEEPLYEFPLNLCLDDPVPHPIQHFCISAIGLESPKAANLPLTSTCQSSKPEPVPTSNQPPTHTCQSPQPEPIQENKPDNIVSKASKHKEVVFIKNPSKTHNISSWAAVIKIVRGLGIPYDNDDFHCPMDCDTPENHIEHQSKKLRLDNLWTPETTPTHRTKLLVKPLSTHAKIPT